ncbi:prolipoprotein diacylglyceryl transferase [Bacillus sp. HMF5848]|uniref:prolipoprotein diacylglyceryl transferase n=1 Tax=Bacillus sp. HMF5848 TaxID=2495421 RepID=UPI000F794414|nr:prolipoprotein diacylglyceryl transferase [Bacillus sp. HMF5848]RSK28570.1 prolipoprotein diacylglyceryl transferase [Bacillus sp. HMF5848]
MEQSIQPLDPVFLKIGPLVIHWYGVIIGVGLLLALLVVTREAQRRGLDKEVFVDLVLFAAPIAIICARIYYVIFEWDYYSKNIGQIFQIWNGGIAIHGALIGSVITAIVFAKVRKLSFWKLADIAAPSLLIGQGIGRWGNFMNQEAHGGPIDVTQIDAFYNVLPDFIMDQMFINGVYYHPTFLYESIWNLLGVALLIGLRRVNLARGEMFLTYVIWYSFGRYFIEGMRTDSLMLTESLRIAQVISIVLIVGAIVLIVVRRMRGSGSTRYLDQNV